MSRASIALLVIFAVAAWAVAAYIVMPAWLKSTTHRIPALDGLPTVTTTSAGIPGDPLNVALVGTQEQMTAIFAAAGWHPADPLSLRDDARIATDAVLDRPYPDAPVSNLYLFGRKEDLAFEMAQGGSPRQRHHVRFWQTPKADASGIPLWVGAASFDRSVGLSHTTGQITHHIAPDIDAERDHVISTLSATGRLTEIVRVSGFQPEPTGRNGGGDPWHTDGTLILAVITPGNVGAPIR